MTGALFQPGPRAIADGAVHVPGWLTIERQRALVEACREWARGPVPMRAASMPNGHRMSVRTVCLGWHWWPYAYSRTADDLDGQPVAEFPEWLGELGRAAVGEAYGEPATDYRPDTALINFYERDARMGMHQDRDERAREPVVSLSIGDSCLFRFGNTEHRGRPYTDVELESGDLFVFGGPSRMAFHGVPAVRPETAEPSTGLREGRINITLRVTGFD